MSATDQELHGRWVQEKDADAFSALVRAHGAMVYATCRRVLGDATEAEDLTQECFWKFARETRPVQSVGAWLHTVATRLCISKLRSDGRRQSRERKYSDDDPNAPTEPAWLEVIAWVDEAIDRLPEGTRDVLVRHYFEGTTHSDLAEGLNVSPSTVTRRIQRGVERIREELSSKGMTVSVAALATGLAAEANAALPSSVQASLVKIGLGAVEKATSVTATASSGLSWGWGSLIAGLVMLILAVGGVTYRLNLNSSNDEALVAESGAQPGTAPQSGSELGQNAEVDTIVVTPVASTPPASETDAPEEVVEAIPVEEEPEAEPEGFLLHGRVVDDGGFPIADADVWAMEHTSLRTHSWKSAHHATTNQAGEYRIEGLPSELSMGVTASATSKRDSDRVFLRGEAGDERRVDFSLEAGADLYGRVVSYQGEPVPSALVHIEGYIQNGGSVGTGGHSAMVSTDESGRFRMGLRRSGIAVVKVTSRDYGQTIFPNVPVGSEEEVLLRLSESAIIFGTIQNERGEPVESVEIDARGNFTVSSVVGTVSAESFIGRGITGPDGRYRITSLPSGLDYTVQVLLQGSQGTDERSLSDRTDLGTLDPGIEREWNYTLREGMDVVGRVVGNMTNRPVGGVQVTYLREGTDTHTAIGIHDGAFSVGLYNPGRFFFYPKLHHYTSEENFALGRWVNWAPGETVTLDLTVPEPFSIGVKAVDVSGAPVALASVSAIWGTQGSTSQFKTARLDEDGTFRFPDCIPGELAYWLQVKQAGYVPSNTTPTAGEPGVEYPEEIVVLRREGGIEGFLHSMDGTPLSNAKFTVAVSAGAEQSSSTMRPDIGVFQESFTDENGYFSVGKGLPEGILDLWFDVRDSEREYEGVLLGAAVEPGNIANLGLVSVGPSSE